MRHENTNYPGLVPSDDEGPELTMSSLEIADLTDRSHDKVMKIIRRTLEVLRKDPDQFLHTVAVIVGDPVVYYRLPRRECEDVIEVGAAFTEDQDNAILRRWDQMEALQKGAHIKAYAERLRAERAAQEATPPLGPVRQMAREDGRQRAIFGFEKITEDAVVPPSIVPHDPQPDATFAIAVKDGPLGVDLRELHRELGSKQEFANWAKSRLSQFVEGEDFSSFDNIIKRETGASRRTEYAVSIDCAKHIAMMEQTERGKQVRRYFIECEKALRAASNPTAPALPQNYVEALRAHLASEEKVLEQAKLLEVQQPAVEFYERFCDADGLASIRNTALSLKIPERVFVRECLRLGVLYRGPRSPGSTKPGPLRPYAEWTKVDKRYLRLVPTVFVGEKLRHKTMFTARGIAWVALRISRNNSGPLTDDETDDEYDIEDS